MDHESAAGAGHSTVLLRITRGFAGPRAIEANGPEITIGRSQDATLRFDPQRDLACASGIHARLTLDAGQWMIECLHPSGLRVIESKGRPRRVEEGQRVAITLPAEIELGSNGPRFEASVTDGPIPATAIGGSFLANQPVTQIPASMLTDVKRSNSRLHWLGVSLAFTVLLLGGSFLLIERSGNTLKPIELGLKYSTQPPADSDRLQEVARRAQGSVWIVGFGDEAGNFTPVGTAWTVQEDKLATNAHVALALQRLVEAESARRTVHMEARRAANDPSSLRLSVGSVHPAFVRWDQILRGRVRRNGMPLQFITPGDVALFQVDEGNPGQPLPLLAADQELAATAVSVGDEVVYVGFPMEGLVGLPTLQTSFGRLTAVTDFFHQHSSDAHHLLHHSAFSAGGASGSPLLNRDGQVIGLITAMNSVAVQGGRVPIGLNYATHVALLQELLAGDARERQDARNPVWEEQLRQASMPDEELMKQLVQSLGVSGDQFDASRVDTFEIREPGQAGMVTRPLLSRGSSDVVVIAHASDRTDIDLVVLDQRSQRLMLNDLPDCFPMLRVASEMLQRPLQLGIVAAQPLDSPCEVTLRIIPVGPGTTGRPASEAPPTGPNRMSQGSET